MIRETVKLRYLHIAPRKARLVANLIKGMPVNEAEAQLMLRPNRVAGPILKLLKSAMANVTNNRKLDAEKFVIEKITVDGGPSFKRFLPRAMGRATPILKRSCHITIILKETDKKSSRFNTVKPKRIKEKEGKKTVKKPANVPKPSAEKNEKSTSASKEKNPGIIKRFFRRKSV